VVWRQSFGKELGGVAVWRSGAVAQWRLSALLIISKTTTRRMHHLDWKCENALMMLLNELFLNLIVVCRLKCAKYTPSVQPRQLLVPRPRLAINIPSAEEEEEIGLCVSPRPPSNWPANRHLSPCEDRSAQRPTMAR
jgi:hypothetical protein